MTEKYNSTHLVHGNFDYTPPLYVVYQRMTDVQTEISV